MNKQLMENIVKHIFANLAIIPSTFVKLDKTKSLMSKDFILNETLSFEVDDVVIKNKIWGCQVSTDQQALKILLGDCSQDKQNKEYCLIVQLINAPAYGIYLACDTNDSEALIACTVNNKDWMECQTYLQATFLAGMEQIRDVGLSWNKCSEYQQQYQLMVSFINFHDSLFGDKYEG